MIQTIIQLNHNNLKIFVINDISLTGGTEKAIKKISKTYEAEIFDLENNRCNSRNLLFDYQIFKNKLKSKKIIELHGFLEYSSFLVCLFCLFHKSISIVWIRTSVKHKIGKKLGFYFYLALLFCDQVNFQNSCQEKEFINKYKFLIYKKRKIINNIKKRNLKKIKTADLKKGLMYAGRLELSKGILEICNFCIQNKIILHIHGYGVLEKEIISLSSSPYIHFCGRYNSFFDINFYSRLIINSDFEGNPNVLFEALSIGLPVYVRKWNDCVVDFFDENDDYFLYDNLSEININKLV